MGPLVMRVSFVFSSVKRPPSPTPTKQPVRSRSASVSSSFASSTAANAAAPSANSVKRSISLSFFFSIQRVGSHPFTSPAIPDPEGRTVELSDGTDAVVASEQSTPGISGSDADWSDETNACDDDAFHWRAHGQGSLPSRAF